MAQQPEGNRQVGSTQPIVHVRENSNQELDALFDVLNKQPLQPQRSWKERGLPPSFFNPSVQRTGNHSRESSTDSMTSGYHSLAQGGPGGMMPLHQKTLSSPAVLGGHLSVAPQQPPARHHVRQSSLGDPIADDSPLGLPPGWDMARTPSGQPYYINHIDKTTTWHDPRKSVSSMNLSHHSTPPPSHQSPNVSMQNLGPLPPGWEQAATPEGEIYFINHNDRNTSWFDPRIPMHLQQPAMNLQQKHQRSLPPQMHQLQQQHQQQQQQQQQAAQQQQPRQLPSPQMTGPNGRQRTLQELQREEALLKRRQEEITKQVQEMMLRQHGMKSELAVSNTGVDPFLNQGSSDYHARQESGDSGLGGMGTNYSLPRTPEDLLGNMDDMDTSEGGHKLQPQQMEFGHDNMTLGNMGESDETSNMDSDDLVPSLREDISNELLNDMESVLNGQDSLQTLTWL
ncbi:transcriptional coactivator YAP1-A isoform X2 [Lingula anatina]|uniref:Transcriptional coactivator YAP1-A isoform X2 n=1 Tax=Lingula anatina TaxID=7574 RepID=A0A1S3I6F5_LINAN|nr:transcriptional coactivator YAP1-A isoform X2 [Lingula anatina]|eukprot:XP_013393837.1 transcriptional coactivator YAP1-A isoform X2 [Lingula anatina]